MSQRRREREQERLDIEPEERDREQQRLDIEPEEEGQRAAEAGR